MCLKPTLIIADINKPNIKPGIEKVNAYIVIVVTMFFVLNPRALSIPNSKVFSSTSESIKE
jgi:hypothetical protein